MSDEQRREALQKANDTRESRARLKRELKSGHTALDVAITAPPEYAHNMQVGELLRAAKGFGRVRVSKLLVRCELAYSKRLGNMSQRQRVLLAEQVRAEQERAYAHAKRESTEPAAPLTANMGTSGHG
jgi:hypothetical protein